MATNINQYENVLEKISIKFGMDIEDRENALSVIAVLKEKKMSISSINAYPHILDIKSSKVANIIDAFREVDLPIEMLEKNPEIIERTNGVRIKKVATLISKGTLLLKILEKNPEIIAVGKDENIEKIIEIFEKLGQDKKFFINYGDILAYGEAGEIEKIVTIFKENDLLKTVIKKNPKAFYKNSYTTIKEIIELYKNPKERLGLNIVKKNPEILSETTKVRIVAIINMLERNGIEKAVIIKRPDIVYVNETKEIENIISKLKLYGVTKEEIKTVPEVLTYDEISTTKLLRKIDFANAYENIFGKLVQENFKIILNANMQTLTEFVEEVEKGNIDKEIIKLEPSILSKTTPANVIKVLENLETVGMKGYHIEKTQILTLTEPEKILEINNVFEELNVDKKYLNNPNIILNGDANNIYNIITEIDKRNMSRELLENSFILIKGEYENISQMLDKLERSENGISKEIIDKSSTVLAEGNAETLEEVKLFLEKRGLLNNPEVEIPGIIFAKGKPEVMEKIYEYFEKNGLLEELKGAMSLLSRPLSNIQKNVDILIEYGMASSLITNISVLGLSTETIEKRLNYLTANGIEPTVAALKMTGEKFNDTYGATDHKINELEPKYLAQVIIQSRFAQYLEKEDETDLDIRQREIYDEIYEEILRLGAVKSRLRGLEYKKAGYLFSNLKIQRNLEKLIYHSTKEIKQENLERYGIKDYEMTQKDKTYITVLAILGNKNVTETEAEEVCRSILNREVEEDDEKYNIVIGKEQKKEFFEQIITDYNDKEAEKEEIEETLEIEEELEEEPKVESAYENLQEYTKEDYEEDLKELGIEEQISIEEEKRNVGIENEKENINISLNEKGKEKEILNESLNVINISEENSELEEHFDLNENKNREIEKAKENSVFKQEEKEEFGIDLEYKEALLREERRIERENNEKEINSLKEKLEKMSDSLLTFQKQVEIRRREEEERKLREQKEELTKIMQRRQEKELEELRRRNEELEKERKIKQEEEIQRKIREEAEKIAKAEVAKLQEELRQKEEIKKIAEEKAKEEARKAINIAIQAEEKSKKVTAINLEEEVERAKPKITENKEQMPKKAMDSFVQETDDIDDYYKKYEKVTPKSEQSISSNQVYYDEITGRKIQTPGGNINSSYGRMSKPNDEFERVMDAYHNKEVKAFFGLEDYGYILNRVNSDEEKKMQMEMNELYKMKKGGMEQNNQQRPNYNNYYDE